MTRPRITPHQRSVLNRLLRLSAHRWSMDGEGWIPASDCGGPAALDHLTRKGYVEDRIEYGPRGGAHKLYRPTRQGRSA